MVRRRDPETATIETVMHDGRGIAAIPGKKVFVAGALPGEEVRFLRRKRRRNFDEAELIEVLEPSQSRIAPRCEVFGTCGGCALQHLAQSDQRGIKLQSLKDSLSRIGGVEPARWLDPVSADGDEGGWHYRRRARLAVKDVWGKDRVLVGFRERHAPYVTDMHRCEILAPPVHALIDALSELIGSLTIRNRLPQIEIAAGDYAVALLFRVLDPPDDRDRDALIAFARQHDLQVALQPAGPDSVETLYPDPAPELSYELPDFDLEISFDATDFVQVNGDVNRLLVAKAVELLDVDHSCRVLDLYCGIGNFSLPLARRAGEVLGLEIESRQIRRAAANARQNGIRNCEFRQRDLSAIDGTERWLSGDWDRLLLDPARSGAIEIARHVDRIGPARIVYVSCHPGTLARDAAVLVRDRGYRLEAAGLVDMFPHTGHVESIAVFNKHK